MMMTKAVYIDPSYPDYYENKLFTARDTPLNRDGTLEPFIRLREALTQQDVSCDTADYLGKQEQPNIRNEYYSFGIIGNYKNFSNVTLSAFVICEPPVVVPSLYHHLPFLTATFERVYLHNTIGDGYSLRSVNQERLHKLYYPMPYSHVIEPCWSNNNRNKRIVVINGNHRPKSFNKELYSKRIEAMASLAKEDCIDLYGRGWERWWSIKSQWFPYWRNYKALMSIYRGSCESKYSVLNQYQFCLCFENMQMDGYVTEKIFDCFYAGTIPLYLGANDITKYVPAESFIDCRQFSNWLELWKYVRTMSEQQILTMKTAGREVIHSDFFKQHYYRSLERIVTV